MTMNEFCDVQQLVKLFNPKVDDSNSEDELDDPKPKSTACQRPDKINNTSEKPVNPYSKIETKESERKEILNPDDEDDYVFQDHEVTTQKDWKKSPKWDICYKQQVTAEDVFLQMGFKNPASASCEDMIVTIELPEENRHNIDLKILKDKLTLISPKFYLDLPLPHFVNPQKGNAKFDAEAEKLIVTLRMDRELDLLNF